MPPIHDEDCRGGNTRTLGVVFTDELCDLRKLRARAPVGVRAWSFGAWLSRPAGWRAESRASG